MILFKSFGQDLRSLPRILFCLIVGKALRAENIILKVAIFNEVFNLELISLNFTNYDVFILNRYQRRAFLIGKIDFPFQRKF